MRLRDTTTACIDHATLARRLRDAYVNGPVVPLRDGLAPTDGIGAYAVQELNTRFWQAQGRRLIGRKIGLTAKAVQVQLGVDQPDYGALFEDMVVPDGGTLDPARLIQPKAEAEIALVLRTDLGGPNVTPEQVAAATDHVVAALEIVDSRIVDWKITFADTVADNGSAAFLVLGERRLLLNGLDLVSCGMVMEINGAVASTGTGAACLGHPLIAAAWLARTVQLRAGDVVLTGALGPMVALSPGDRVHASIGGLGTVSFKYGVAT